MDSSLGEPAATFLHYGYPDATELLRSLTYLPVLGPPNTVYFYNNTTYAAGGYLPPLSLGIPPEELEAGYARLMQERVFGPAGMRGARLADDPRPFTDDYATGYAVDFVEGTAAEGWAPLGSFAPAGGTLAGLTDMGAYVRLQLRCGVSPTGSRVVSARNLEECWKPHIDDYWSPTVEPDVIAAGYAMGWVAHTYTGGRRLIWHNGEIDGFTTYIGLFPEDDLGLAVLTNKQIGHGAFSFYTYVLNLLLESRFGLNRGANEAVVAEYEDDARALASIAAQARPVDAGAIAPFLGFYERGYRLWLDAAGMLRLQPDARTTRLLAMPDGSYVRSGGLLAGRQVRFHRDQMDVPMMELEGLETVRWLSGPA
jgi:CubicO group peptidase (beta-lactamase class C family)